MESLPLPVQCSILQRCAPSDVLRFSQVSRSCHAAASDNSVWKHLCNLSGFPYHTPAAWGCANFRDLFINVVYHGRHLPGVWGVGDTCFGGVLAVRAEPPDINAYALVVQSLSGGAFLERVWSMSPQQYSQHMRQTAASTAQARAGLKRRSPSTHMQEPFGVDPAAATAAWAQAQEQEGGGEAQLAVVLGQAELHEAAEDTDQVSTGDSDDDTDAGFVDAEEHMAGDDDGVNAGVGGGHDGGDGEGSDEEEEEGEDGEFWGEDEAIMVMLGALEAGQADLEDLAPAGPADSPTAPEVHEVPGVTCWHNQHSAGANIRLGGVAVPDLGPAALPAVAEPLVAQMDDSEDASPAAQASPPGSAAEDAVMLAADSKVQHSAELEAPPPWQVLRYSCAHRLRHHLPYTMHRFRQPLQPPGLNPPVFQAVPSPPGAPCSCRFPDVDPRRIPLSAAQFMLTFMQHLHTPSAWGLLGHPGISVSDVMPQHEHAYVRCPLPPLPAPEPADGDGTTGHPLEGLWRGTYGGHGIELLLWTRVAVPSTHPVTAPSGPSLPDSQAPEGGAGTSQRTPATATAPPAPGAPQSYRIVALKLVGDSNIPAGTVTLELLQHLPPFDKPTVPVGHVFRVPRGYRSMVVLPDLEQAPGEGGAEQPPVEPLVVQAVHRARGQIAGTGFHDPQWTDVELVEFKNPSTCARHSAGPEVQCYGVLWHALNSFSLFTRVQVA